MKAKELQESWKEQGEEVFAAVAQWRETNPKATLAEIETAVEQQINRLRGQMIQEAAQPRAVRQRAMKQWKGGCVSTAESHSKHEDASDADGRLRETSKWKSNGPM